MTDWPILSTVTYLPLVGAALMLLTTDRTESGRRNIRLIAMATTIATFLLSMVIWWNFNSSSPAFQMVEHNRWLVTGIDYHLGVDGISVLFILLTTILMPFCILASWEAINHRVKAYMIAFMLLETMIIGVFVSLDIVMFYIFFEGGLIPMYLIIGIWGHERRVYASIKFFLYTLAGSVLMMLAIMGMYWQTGTTSVPELLHYNFPVSMQYVLFFCFFLSFAVKMPMWPLHTWLPDAHVEAPTAASGVLAGVLLKLGGFGILRYSIPMFPAASFGYAPLVYVLSIIAVIYASLVALAQKDMKKMIAYSSIAHMGFVTMGMFAGKIEAVQGAIFLMFSHGIVSGALFLCIGVLYDRLHSREIADYGGLVSNMPKFAVVFMVFIMGNVGLPGTSGFVGEFLTLLGTFRANTIVAAFAALGVILSAVYSLWLYRKVVFGTVESERVKLMPDLNLREKFVLYPLVALTILFGVYPAPILDLTKAAVHSMMNSYYIVQQANAAALLVK